MEISQQEIEAIKAQALVTDALLTAVASVLKDVPQLRERFLHRIQIADATLNGTERATDSQIAIFHETSKSIEQSVWGVATP